MKADLDGVAWDEISVPPRNHVCWTQTKLVGRQRTIRRCPCGGWSHDGKNWLSRNSRRRPWWKW